MLKPEEFAVELIGEAQPAMTRAVTMKIAARDAEVREEKRREVAQSVCGLGVCEWPGATMVKLDDVLALLQPPAPAPSERAMRAASAIVLDATPTMGKLRPMTQEETIQRRIEVALLIDAEFGAGK